MPEPSSKIAIVGLAGRFPGARSAGELPPGAMLAVTLPEAETVPRLGDGLSLAAVNGSGLSVVSGREEAVTHRTVHAKG